MIMLSISAAQFLTFAKIEGILWSISDVFLVFFALVFINMVRKHMKIKRYKKLFYLLFFSFAITPLILFTQDFFWFLVIEIIVLNIQYFILIHIAIENKDILWKFFQERII